MVLLTCFSYAKASNSTSAVDKTEFEQSEKSKNAESLLSYYQKEKCYMTHTELVGYGVVTNSNGEVTNVFPIYETTLIEIECPKNPVPVTP